MHSIMNSHRTEFRIYLVFLFAFYLFPKKLLLRFLVHFLPFPCFTSDLINEISGIMHAIQIQAGHSRRRSTLPALMPLPLAIQHFLRQFGIGFFALLPTASVAQEAGGRGHQRTSKPYRTQGQGHEARLASHSMACPASIKPFKRCANSFNHFDLLMARDERCRVKHWECLSAKALEGS